MTEKILDINRFILMLTTNSQSDIKISKDHRQSKLKYYNKTNFNKIKKMKFKSFEYIWDKLIAYFKN